jgi:hypothetical protein
MTEYYFGERARARTLRLFKTSWGTMKGLSLNPKTWIRDDWWLTECSIPDTDNDEVKGSSVARDSPNKTPAMGSGEICSK